MSTLDAPAPPVPPQIADQAAATPATTVDAPAPTRGQNPELAAARNTHAAVVVEGLAKMQREQQEREQREAQAQAQREQERRAAELAQQQHDEALMRQRVEVGDLHRATAQQNRQTLIHGGIAIGITAAVVIAIDLLATRRAPTKRPQRQRNSR